MRDSDQLLVEDEGAVRWVTFDRPDKRNALTRAMADGLADALRDAESDASIGALVVTGAGDTFSAGADTKELFEGPDAALTERRDRPIWPVEALYAFPKPVIACVNGPAWGGGATLAMAADLRVAASSAAFTFHLAKLGLTPEFGSSFLLWRQVGYGVALDLLLTGRTVAADEALDLRLVSRVVPDADSRQATQELAGSIASLPAGAANATKAVLRAGLESTFAEARKTELRALRDQGRKLRSR